MILIYLCTNKFINEWIKYFSYRVNSRAIASVIRDDNSLNSSAFFAANALISSSFALH